MKKTLYIALVLLTTLSFSSCNRNGYFAQSSYGGYGNYVKSEKKSSPVIASQNVAVVTTETLPTIQPILAENVVLASNQPELTREIAIKTAMKRSMPVLANISAETKKEIVEKVSTMDSKTTKKVTKSLSAKPVSGGKSQLVAAVLAFVVGAFGIHRFYLGYTVIGVIQLLTLGGLGLWALIDLVRILLGDLTPKDGDYTDKL